MAKWLTALTVRINTLFLVLQLILVFPLALYLSSSDFEFSELISSVTIWLLYLLVFGVMISLAVLLALNALYGKLTKRKYSKDEATLVPHLLLLVVIIPLGMIFSSLTPSLITAVFIVFSLYVFLVDVALVLNGVTAIVGIVDFFKSRA